MTQQVFNIFTDGACSGNPGIGGWSCIAYNNNIITDAYTGSENLYINGHLVQKKETTNNRMEIMGLLKALELATTKYKNKICLIHCDSSYCVNLFNQWIKTWASNNWINSEKKEVKNLDLIKQLYEYTKIDFPNFQILKVKGHNNILGNELADAYAIAEKNGDATKLAKILKENNITLAIE